MASTHLWVGANLKVKPTGVRARVMPKPHQSRRYMYPLRNLYTRACTPVGFAVGASCFNENTTSVQKRSAPHPPEHIINPPTTIACNVSGTYSEAEKRVERALDEMRALDFALVIADFAGQYSVPYNQLYKRFHGTRSKSDRVSGNRRFSGVEEKAICRYLDRLDKFGLPAQRELLQGVADHILLTKLDAS